MKKLNTKSMIATAITMLLMVSLLIPHSAYAAEPVENPFTDVPESEYFYRPVLWAAENHIVKGMTEHEFGPNLGCNRAMVATFLHRFKGTPAPQSPQCPFTDVPSNEYYYDAVLWAAENGITTGATATTFAPVKTCTREQIVTFLWRASGMPEPQSLDNPFTDVDEQEYSYRAILWAAENGITTGATATTFAPTQTCTRCQVVTFLYRTIYPQEKPAEPVEPGPVQPDQPGVYDGPYILNTNSKKFHYPTCPSANKISSQNRAEFEGSRDELIERGYTPCKNCRP